MGHLSMFDKNKQEFHLENVIEKNAQFPRTFLIPTQEEIDKLAVGKLVKLIFVIEEPHDNPHGAERMWVELTSKQNNTFTGILNNEPYYLKCIKAGDMISFKAENIAAIYGGESPFDEKQFAIITKKALDNRQINWVVRTDDIEEEFDSGWQLFYGDEDEEYLEDPDNATLVTLGYILSFEPLLESVFSSLGYAYEYSENDNKFLQVKE